MPAIQPGSAQQGVHHCRRQAVPTPASLKAHVGPAAAGQGCFGFPHPHKAHRHPHHQHRRGKTALASQGQQTEQDRGGAADHHYAAGVVLHGGGHAQCVEHGSVNGVFRNLPQPVKAVSMHHEGPAIGAARESQCLISSHHRKANLREGAHGSAGFLMWRKKKFSRRPKENSRD